MSVIKEHDEEYKNGADATDVAIQEEDDGYIEEVSEGCGQREGSGGGVIQSTGN